MPFDFGRFFGECELYRSLGDRFGLKVIGQLNREN